MRTSLLCSFCIAAIAAIVVPHASRNALAIESADIPMPSAEKYVIRVTERGLEPKKLLLTKKDSSVFIFNDAPSSLITIEIPFGKRRVHCASGNLQFDPTGTARSTTPISPNDFALLCFPDSGQYELRIQGLENSPDGISGLIVVTP